MARRNPMFEKIEKHYLFPEVQRRVQASGINALISLGIGDLNAPLPKVVQEALAKREDYSGYGPAEGDKTLREMIAKSYYPNKISPNEIFISDGAKCDVARLQTLFSPDATVAVQDPTYPVYVDSSLLSGKENIVPFACTPYNAFFPDLTPTDLIFFCSPNNPTGVAATREQLESLVKTAQTNSSIIIFDAAYSAYIQDPTIPRSIYEIDGAKEVAIEVCSFSKLAGFTGLRLGWSVVPKELTYKGEGSLHSDWSRVVNTLFNGASKIVQQAGIAALSDEGQLEINQRIAKTMQGVARLKAALNFPVYGGKDTPYLWVDCGGNDSWKHFDAFLQQAKLITTPGSGFGKAGEGFIRLSAFGALEEIDEACGRLKKWNRTQK